MRPQKRSPEVPDSGVTTVVYICISQKGGGDAPHFHVPPYTSHPRVTKQSYKASSATAPSDHPGWHPSESTCAQTSSPVLSPRLCEPYSYVHLRIHTWTIHQDTVAASCVYICVRHSLRNRNIDQQHDVYSVSTQRQHSRSASAAPQFPNADT